MNFTLEWCCFTLTQFNSRFHKRHFLRKAHSCLLRLLFTCRSLLPNSAIRKSSAITSTPSRSSTNSFMVCYHTSGAEQMPNGIWLYWYRPNGVLNMVYKFKADELQVQCLFQLKKALYIAYKCKECLGNWQSIMVHKLFPIPSIRYACRE